MTPRIQREWTFAIIEVGLQDELFWRLTPGEFYSLCDAWRARETREIEFRNRLTARQCAFIANTVRDSKKRPKPFTEDDFMPKTKEQIEADAADDGIWASALSVLGQFGIKEVTSGR